jgi:predicted RNase H-like HicB family nuclease
MLEDTMAQAKAVKNEWFTYTVVFEPDKEAGGYTATCPALPGLVTEGDTLEEARAMAADAVKAYLESLRQHGDPIPLSEEYETEPFREAVTVRLEGAWRAGCQFSGRAGSSGHWSAPASRSIT